MCSLYACIRDSSLAYTQSVSYAGTTHWKMDATFLPSTPPAHKDNCKSQLSAHAHEEREYFERAELENMFNFGVEERDHQREMFFQDLEKHPQEIDFCRFHNIRRGKNWHVNLQDEHWNMDPSSESEGSSALDDEVKTQRPETLSLQSGARQTEELKVEHGEYPWRHTLQNDDDAKYVTVTLQKYRSWLKWTRDRSIR